MGRNGGSAGRGSNGSKQAGAGRNPTAEETAAAIRARDPIAASLVSDFVGGNFVSVNRFLRLGVTQARKEGGAKYAREKREEVRRLQAALVAAPKTVGPTLRGADMPEHILERMTPGASWTAKTMMSTSQHAYVPRGFEGNTTFHIKNARGVNVQSFAGHLASAEREILLPAGRSFKVISHTVSGGKHIIHLHQVN